MCTTQASHVRKSRISRSTQQHLIFRLVQLRTPISRLVIGIKTWVNQTMWKLTYRMCRVKSIHRPSLRPSTWANGMGDGVLAGNLQWLGTRTPPLRLRNPRIDRSQRNFEGVYVRR